MTTILLVAFPFLFGVWELAILVGAKQVVVSDLFPALLTALTGFRLIDPLLLETLVMLFATLGLATKRRTGIHLSATARLGHPRIRVLALGIGTELLVEVEIPDL